MTARAKKNPLPIRDDPRVVELADCVVFALNAFRNRPVWDNERQVMEGWHDWFRRALEGAGYKITESGKGAT